MVRTNRVLASLGVAVAALAVACGGSSGSQFGDGTDPSQAPPGPGDPNQIGGGGGFNSDPVGTNAACVTNTANAHLAPANLIFMYDRSGSMGDPAEGGDPNVKWIPLTSGMTSFFNDPASKGINASIQFFPANGSLDVTCGADYSLPRVSLTSDTAQVLAAITATKPQGGTPTLPALQGAVKYAQQVAAQHPDDKTAVVLVTDGEPGFYISGQQQPGCANNDVSHVASTAQVSFVGQPSIPVYVIGVGPNLQSLNAIAQAGGTASAFMISVADPASTQQQLLTALNTVRAQSVSCNFALPPPPAGEQLDTARVNVAYESSSGESVLTYSADCSANGGTGWHYDNPASPSRIELCPTTCTTVQADPSGGLKLAFGCQTKGATK
jgi:hypothetical protein